MKTPVQFTKRLLRNPWFLWFLILLGVNPAPILDSVPLATQVAGWIA